MFGGDFMVKENLNLECGFMSWKLLSKIQIDPAGQDYKRVICELGGEQVGVEKEKEKEEGKSGAKRQVKEYQEV